jgi:hypothetical protein
MKKVILAAIAATLLGTATPSLAASHDWCFYHPKRSECVQQYYGHHHYHHEGDDVRNGWHNPQDHAWHHDASRNGGAGWQHGQPLAHYQDKRNHS